MFFCKSRPACRRQRDDMVLLAHVRSVFALSNGTYGSPRMVQELRDSVLLVGLVFLLSRSRSFGGAGRTASRFAIFAVH
jgi:putative transposase